MGDDKIELPEKLPSGACPMLASAAASRRSVEPRQAIKARTSIIIFPRIKTLKRELFVA